MRAILIFAASAATVSAQAAVASSSALYSITSSAALASASGSSSTNATSTHAVPVTHTVAVARGGHSFSPDVVLAEVGDTIEYQFYPTNHSVIRAAYGYPCVPYEDVMGRGHYGFFSGFHPVDAVLENPPKWQVVVNDTEPIFYYCGAPNSCIGYGMVGVINPNASTSLERQRQLAESSTFMLLPGQDWPAEGSPSSTPSKSTSTSTSATASPTNAATTVTAAPATSHGLSGGAIAGIAIGAAIVIVAAGAAVWFCGRSSRRSVSAAPVAPAQEVQTPYAPMAGMYGNKPGHMSVVSGYTMPPGYDTNGQQHPMRSPTMQTVDPMTGQVLPSGAVSPNLNAQNAAPAYVPGQGQMASMYAPGVHNVAPVEIDSTAQQQGRKSLEKTGVERYS